MLFSLRVVFFGCVGHSCLLVSVALGEEGGPLAPMKAGEVEKGGFHSSVSFQWVFSLRRAFVSCLRGFRQSCEERAWAARCRSFSFGLCQCSKAPGTAVLQSNGGGVFFWLG